MSDAIKHECGIAIIRLRKPLQYYVDKYGSPKWAVDKMYLLMEKQHNRGQDGAGVANIKIDVEPGQQYIFRQRSIEDQPLADIFKRINKKFRKAREDKPSNYQDASWLTRNVDYTGEVWLGHLRYGTHSTNTIDSCHPMLRANSWRSRNLVLAGNFNMTNVDELFGKLLQLGQHPKEMVDTVTVMEKIGHFLDEEVQRQFEYLKSSETEGLPLSQAIENAVDLARVLQRSCRDFDGGYAMAGITGYGAAFVARDPAGIRPAYYYADDEVVVVASEKPAIKTAFGVQYQDIQEVKPGHALIIKKDGTYGQHQFITPVEKRSCSFERIYFSRGTDPNIYQERKKLGELLAPQVLEAVDYDTANTVFSYIPNTAETAFMGLIAGVDAIVEKARLGGQHTMHRPRTEKLVIKDVKMRTFITNDSDRDSLVSHVYDTTYEVIRKQEDTIVVIDDSIVRGTTLEKSILTMLDKLEAKHIVIVSSAPQIRYPDCYGIDMSRMKDFVAFRACMELLKERGLDNLIEETYEACLAALANGTAKDENLVKRLYAPFSDQEISDKVAQIVTPKTMRSKVSVIFQTVDNLHKATPDHTGDWYFTGNYPTPGGNKVVNQAFVNYMEGKTVRAY